MNTVLKSMTATLGLGLLGALFAAEANASCSNLDQMPAPSPFQQQSAQGIPGLMKIGLFQTSSGPTIVGLWKFKFVAQGNGPSGPPDGALIDSGYVTWHDDGTELMNSGRAPTTGDFCMGVWKQVNPTTYRLNHFALAWEFDPNTPPTAPGAGGADFVGPANIRETVTLAPGGYRYSGRFELIQYAADEKTVLAHIKGRVTASRITVDTKI
jgi:hypothetical protein